MTIDLAQIAADEMFGRLSHAQAHAARSLTHNQQVAAEELARPCCGRCGIPRSDYDGHWCSDETWRGWES